MDNHPCGFRNRVACSGRSGCLGFYIRYFVLGGTFSTVVQVKVLGFECESLFLFKEKLFTYIGSDIYLYLYLISLFVSMSTYVSVSISIPLSISTSISLFISTIHLYL